ncbi:MFS transporter [Rhodococcus sp. NPDC057529]|uniref:MFS transporter n=1 Tax=Rhodococcus sp. NPDC057529 TaxID=3346158 RepID=UPI00366DA08A
MDLLHDIRQAPMTRFQVVTIAIALALIILDGIDVAVMAYAAPVLSREWDIDGVALGLLLSASLFGMAAGSIFLTPLADKIGRRALTIVALSLAGTGMILSIFATGPTDLMIYRIITGLGVGGMMANLIVLVSEYCSDKRRGAILGVYSAGYPIGATLGGMIVGPLLPAFGWRSVFVVGAALTVLLLLLSIRALPESLDFLLTKRPTNALNRINAILAKMKRPALTELPDVHHPRADSVVREILTPPIRFRTLMLWIGYACLVAAYYFVNTWTPKIIATSSGNDSLGVTVGVIANAGGIIGCLIFGALALRFHTRLLLVAALTLSALTYIGFGLMFQTLSVAIAIALLLGILTTAAIAGFYSSTPEVYSARSRATGMGWMIGVGRLMSIVAPILVGVLLDGGLKPENVFYLFAIPLAVAALCVLALGVSVRRGDRSVTGSAPTAPVPPGDRRSTVDAQGNQ